MNQLEKISLPDLGFITEKLLEMPQAECPITHHFSDGVYVRERFASAGTLIVGKRHRHETTSILLSGELGIYIDGTTEAVMKKAPCIWKTEPNTKRMTYSVTDTRLMTIHPTKETDIEEIEKVVIIPEDEYMLTLENKELIS